MPTARLRSLVRPERRRPRRPGIVTVSSINPLQENPYDAFNLDCRIAADRAGTSAVLHRRKPWPRRLRPDHPRGRQPRDHHLDHHLLLARDERRQKRTWLQEERRLHAYRHPGQYRETFLDKAGKPEHIEITDARVGRTLVLDPNQKKAVLKTSRGYPDVRGPFAWVGEALRERMVAKVLPVKSVSLQGTKEIDGIQRRTSSGP